MGGRIDPDEEELAEATSWADSLLARAVAHVAKLHPDVDFHARTVKGDIEDGLLQESSMLNCWWSSGTVTPIWPRLVSVR